MFNQCCGIAHYNPRCAAFYASVIFALSTLIFCFYKLTNLQDGEDRSVYIGLISGIIGTFVPNPKLPGDKSRNNGDVNIARDEQA